MALAALAAMAAPSLAAAAPRLEVTMTQSPSGDLKNGQEVTFTATAENVGSSATKPADQALSSFYISTTVPDGMDFVGVSTEDDSYFSNPETGFNGCQAISLDPSQPTTVTCITHTDQVLEPGESTPAIHVTLRVGAEASGSITNRIGAYAPDANGSASTTFDVIPAPVLSLSATHSGDLFKKGSTGVYDIDVGNAGPVPTDGTAVTVTDRLPSGLTFASADSAGGHWSCSGTQTVTCTSTAPIAAGGAAPTLHLTVDIAGSTADTVDNDVTVEGGGNAGQVNATDTTAIFSAAAQPVRLSVDPTSAADPDGVSGSYLRLRNTAKPGSEPILIDLARSPERIVLEGGMVGGDLRIPQSSIDVPEFTVPDLDLGLAQFGQEVMADLGVGLHPTADWTGTIGPDGTARMKMPMTLGYDINLLNPLPIEMGRCESGPVTLGGLTTGHQDPPASGIEPPPATDGSAFADGSGVVVQNDATVGPMSCSYVNPLVSALTGLTPSLLGVIGNGVVGTPSPNGSPVGAFDARLELHLAHPATDPVLSLQKTVTSDLTLGGEGGYRLEVANTGDVATDGSDLTVTDQLPEGVSYDSFSSADPNWDCSADGDQVTCTLTGETLEPGASAPPVDLTVALDDDAWPGATNVATVSGGGAGGASSTARYAELVVDGPQLGMAVTDPADGFTVGAPDQVITVGVENVGSASSSGRIDVEGHLAPGIVFDPGGNPGAWTCSADDPDESGQDVSCYSYSSIAVNGSNALTVPVIVTSEAADAVQSTWGASGGGAPGVTDPGAKSPRSAVHRSKLTLKMSHAGDFRVGGAGGSFTLSVANEGDGSTTSNPVTVTDILPTGLTFQGVSSDGGYWDCSADGQKVTCSTSAAAPTPDGGSHAGEILPGSSPPDIEIDVSVGDPPYPSLTNRATLRGGASAPAAASVVVNTGRPDLSVSSTHSGDFTVGEQGVYRLLVSNDGNAATDGSAVTLTDSLPEGLSFAGASSAGGFWSCAAAGPEVSCTATAAIESRSSAPVVRLRVGVAEAARPGVTNRVRVTGGGSLPAHAADPTSVVAPVPESGGNGGNGSGKSGPRFARIKVKPKTRRIKPGGRGAFRVRIRNDGGSRAARAKVCIKAPKRLVKVRGKKCRRLGGIGAGRAETAKFKLRLKKKAKRRNSVKVRFTAYARKTDARRAGARIKVKAGKRHKRHGNQGRHRRHR